MKKKFSIGILVVIAIIAVVIGVKQSAQIKTFLNSKGIKFLG